MVTNPVSNLFKQALTTFTCERKVFTHNLQVLKTILDRITAEDVNLPVQFRQDSFWQQRPDKAPVTYIDIYEDEVFTMGIFVLRAGMKLPLHDHPDMHGLIKVIAGRIKVTSFSLNTSKVLEYSQEACNRVCPLQVIAEKNPDMIIDVQSQSCLLQPTVGNLHEIESIDGPAAFLDILAPPYDTLIPDRGPRKCTYFDILCQFDPQVYKLEETASPRWFWNDTYPYTGPDLF